MTWKVESYDTFDQTEPATKVVPIVAHAHQMIVVTLGAADARDYNFTGTFNGVALKVVASAEFEGDDDAGVSMKYLDISGLATGNYNLYYTCSSGSPDAGSFAYVIISGGNGKDLKEDVDTDSGVDTNPTVNLTTTEPNTLLVDVLFSDGDNTKTKGAGQTQIFQIEQGGHGNRFCMSYKNVVAIGAATMEWDNSNDECAYVGCAFNPAPNRGGIGLFFP